ncbi:hypothetical protein [Paenibacillus sp. LHD-38]|nr:hypothetical protein [Paenibacillus sp. LHD-38]MDQ8734263.1 hypothetical protein [Paenibacillus sp. LHD-38]
MRIIKSQPFHLGHPWFAGRCGRGAWASVRQEGAFAFRKQKSPSRYRIVL